MLPAFLLLDIVKWHLRGKSSDSFCGKQMYSALKSFKFDEYDQKLRSSTGNYTTKPVEKTVETVNNLSRNVGKTRKYAKKDFLN